MKSVTHERGYAYYVTSRHRYLSCIVENGYVYLSYVRGIDGVPHLSYWTREDARKIFDPGRGDRVVHSVTDLLQVIRESLREPLRMVFVAEGLEDEVRHRNRGPRSLQAEY